MFLLKHINISEADKVLDEIRSHVKDVVKTRSDNIKKVKDIDIISSKFKK
jgi:ribosomal protein L4